MRYKKPKTEKPYRTIIHPHHFSRGRTGNKQDCCGVKLRALRHFETCTPALQTTSQQEDDGDGSAKKKEARQSQVSTRLERR